MLLLLVVAVVAQTSLSRNFYNRNDVVKHAYRKRQQRNATQRKTSVQMTEPGHHD
jgi:hypothetical protein